MKDQILKIFADAYGDNNGVSVYFAPGRVNLIGEHTDYNGGHVFPCALTYGTYMAVRRREDRTLRFFSENFKKDGIYEADLLDIKPDKAAGWTNYPKGVIRTFIDRGFALKTGLDIAVLGDIPASGLSSSASLEVVTGLMLCDQFGFDLSLTDIALIGQYSENHFNGMNCGIMDQFASAMGKKDHAIFLDTNTLDYQYAPVILEDACILLTNSNVKHSLVDSKYNERRSQCEEARDELKKVTGKATLGDLSEEEFEANKHVISDPICVNRAKHAVYENQRTIRAVKALEEGNIEEFGKLMVASHVSLRDDYEVSCPEIDVLVEEALKIDGVIGTRITGGGFGGCTVSIVKNDAVEEFKEKVGKAYEERCKLKADFYVAGVGAGARKL